MQARGGLAYSGPYGSAGTIYLNDLDTNDGELIVDNSGVDKARAAITLLDLGETGELGEKLTIVNANVKLVGGKLGVVSLKDSVLTQAGDAQVGNLQLSGGIWDQAGFALQADSHSFGAGATLRVGSAFNGLGVSDLLVDGFTLELSNSGSWSSVRVLNGGGIGMVAASGSQTQGITITAGSIEVDATSRIDVSGKGLLGTTAIGNYSGGSYGGSGGLYNSAASTNAPYGDFRAPKDLGTGGRATANNFTRGGGAMELQAKLLKLDGKILANGQTDINEYGSGSGGSVLLRVDTLELGGAAQIQANGGGSTASGVRGGGGGGRIAVYYRTANTTLLPPVTQARGGVGYEASYGSAGTIYLNDLDTNDGELIVDNSGVDKARAAITLLDLGGTGELGEKLTIVNANVKLVGGKLGVVSLKDSVLTQTRDVLVGNLQASGGIWDQAGFALQADSHSFSDGASLLMSGSFNWASTDLVVDGFTAVMSKSGTWGKVRVINGGVITTLQASDTFTTAITITADDIEVDASSRIDVSGKGFLPSGSVSVYCGGSHGGKGGIHGSCTTNETYGSYRAPVTFGTGGRGYKWPYTYYQTRGGGAIKLITRSLRLDGQLLANGESASYISSSYIGGGAGGSIWVDTQTLLGSATSSIQALGGRGISGGGGSGGRIAIYYSTLDGLEVLSQISVAGGGGSGTAAEQGSLHLENRMVPTAVTGTDLGEQIGRNVTKFTVDFINAVDAESVTTEVVKLTGPSGPVSIIDISSLSAVQYQFTLGDTLADGTYELRIGPGIRSAQGYGMDQNGNGVEDEAEDVFIRQFVVDRLPPVAPVITSPAVAPAINSLNLPRVTLQGEREGQTAILVNGVLRVGLGSGSWTVIDQPLLEGSSELRVQARDTAGNLSSATLLKFGVDSISPSIQEVSHSDWTKAVPSSVWVRFREAGSGLDFAHSALTLKQGTSSISGRLTLDNDVLRLTPGATLLEGSYSMDVRLRDKAGNQADSTYNFTLDYTPPVAPVVSGFPTVTTSQFISVNIAKESGGTLHLRSANQQILKSVSGAGESMSWDLTLEPGDNRFTAEQVDAAGNVSPRTSFQVRFDNQAPGPVTFSIDPKGSGTGLKLAWADYDEVANGNDIQEYRVYSASQPFSLMSQAQQVASVSAGSKMAVVGSLPRGEERHYAVVAVDRQGLMQSSVVSQAATPEDVEAPEEAASLTVVAGAETLDLSWLPSPNKAGDLTGYALYIGESDPVRIDLPLSSLQTGLKYRVDGLAATSANPLRLVVVDKSGNESAGLRNAGLTWLNNPQNLQLQPFSNRFEAQWSAVQPTSWVSGYRIYVADTPFSSVQGMSAKVNTAAGQTSTAVAGLLNNKTYHVAVTVVNASGGESPQVQSFSVTPAADSTGPELTGLTWESAQGAQDMREGGELSRLGEWRIQAKDESGIDRIELRLNGQLLGQARQADGYYRFSWDLTKVTDGDYSLGLKLFDTLGNQSEAAVSLSVSLAPPAAPTLSLQSKASRTNNPQQVLIVQGQAKALAQVMRNGSLDGELVALDASGRVEVPLALEEGDNQLAARLRHASREQFGVSSAELPVTLDTSIPNAPANLQAIAKPLGVVQLSWGSVSNVSGYNLYSARQPFEAITDSGVSKLNSEPLTTLSYQHQTSEDVTHYYRVSSVNLLGSEGLLSSAQSVLGDSTPPKVELAQYSSLGAVSSDGRYAPGRIEVRLSMSETLRNAPFFSLDVQEGTSIPVRMSQVVGDPLAYQGSFDLASSVPTGLLYARVSAYDSVGNEGTEVLEGQTLRVDTQGPDLQQLSLLPEHPVENLVVDGLGREVLAVLRLSEDPVELPQLTPLLDGQALATQLGPLQLSLDAQSQPGAPVYRGSFRLPAEAGKSGVQLLGFAYRATDDLGNVSQRILDRSEFQVYQGDLPPLDIPMALTGKALAAGRVQLDWREVAEAGAYQVYRRAESESAFVPVARVRELQYIDDLPVAGLPDGRYFYQVASIRTHEDKEALSLPSEAVEVQVVSKAPSAPRDLKVELNGAGIVLRWLAPVEGQAVSYKLYRANVSDGEQIDVAGLPPLQSGIPELIALDSRPSATEHAYTVTAVDAAGNESAPAASAYLNIGLLPVSDLSISLAEGQAPRLQWDHNGADVVGYNVYVGPEGSREKLNGGPITGKSHVDQGVALPLNGERLYSLTAVDANGVESLPHSLLLPALKAELRPEQKFERGVFNQLHYRVSNFGNQDLRRLRLRVNVDSDGQVRSHLSDYFDVARGSLSEVAVVVGGYADLPGVIPLTAELVYAPQVGEQVTISSSHSILAGDNALVAQLLGDEFTRGGVGQVRLRLENPTAVATELVTARKSGNQASDEMRLIMEDLQGNVLASQAIQLAVGNGLVTVRDGRSVARVGALDVLETGPFSINVPVAAPEQVRLRLEADFLHHQTGMPGELKIGGLRASRELTLIETPYYGELGAIEPEQVQAGSSLTLRGRAINRADQQPLAGAELSLVLAVRGFEQVIRVVTDAQGAFAYQYKTSASDSGEYQVSLVYPGIQTRPVHGRFLVQGAAFSPSKVDTRFPRNYEQPVTIVVEAGYDTPLKNLRLEYVQPTGTSGLPTGIKVQQGSSLNLEPRQRGTIVLRISGDNSAAASGLLDYRIVADGLARPLGQTRIQYNLVESMPVAKVSPGQIRTGMERESEEVDTVSLSNTGLEALRNVRLSLLNEQGGSAPDWVSLRSAQNLGDLPVGSSLPIDVAFRPGATVPEGDYYITLRIESDNHATLGVPMSAAVTQSGKGGAIFQVEDIYTGTLDEQGQRILGLKGARIKLQNRNVLTSEFTVTTDERGQALLQDIPAGEYSYRISAWDHEDLAGQLWIKPGVIQDERVFLMSKLVTVEWSVKDITLQDRYEIILNATFKTNVPTALVMIEPLVINLPAMRKGDVFQGELTMTNYGLIRADNVKTSLPVGDARTRIEYLRAVPDVLAAGDVVVIPYRIVALQSFDPDDELNGAAGCWGFRYHGRVSYDSICANGMVVPGGANVSWSASGGTSSCGDSGSVDGGGGGGGGWGGWGGSGVGFIPRPTPMGSTKQCPPPPDCEKCSGSNGGGN